MIQVLVSIATHAVALLLYPGLFAMVAFGTLIELAWLRLSAREWDWPVLPRRRPTPVVATVALCSVMAGSVAAGDCEEPIRAGPWRLAGASTPVRNRRI